MSRLTDLIRQAKAKDPALGADLETEFHALSERRVFGLNFERHRPEAVELPQRPVRKGDKVRVLQPRGTTDRGDQRLWQVASIETADGARVGHLSLIGSDDADKVQTVLVEDLVVVAAFRDSIYPGLVSTGKVERGGDKPFHTVINAENYHAVQTLLFTHRGKVDCIYIDPPYNTGSKDWKYNNDYVEGDDLYRHSKWLAFMERRLFLAKELLDPGCSVLIVTIDEKEYLRLGLLLEQVFPEADVQMVSSVINTSGAVRQAGFARVDEYIFFVFVGTAQVQRNQQDMLTEDATGKSVTIWRNLIRDSGSANRRQDRWRQFYPVFVDVESRRIIGSGEPIPLNVERTSAAAPPGTVAVFPLRINGDEGYWQLGRESFENYRVKGYVKVGQVRGGRISLNYLRGGEVSRIQAGTLRVVGRADTGELLIDANSDGRPQVPKSVWNLPSHSAPIHGSGLVRSFIPGRRFPYPKSLYAVEDALRFFIKDQPEATVVDFFAGSGTTAHAVMRLNRQDGGKRKSISVTNNEVSAEEQEVLRRKGLRPGDGDWERHGICEYITKPRLAAAVTGTTPDGEQVKGDYKYTDEFPMSEGFEENVEFFTLTYETPWRVARNRAFAVIAPLLWMRAGSEGRRIEKLVDGWGVADTYGVVEDLDQTTAFLAQIAKTESVSMAFIVTDDDRRFQMVCAALPDRVEQVRLYESYLRNFEINSGRE